MLPGVQTFTPSASPTLSSLFNPAPLTPLSSAGVITGDSSSIDATNLTAVSGQMFFDSKGSLVADTTGFVTPSIANPIDTNVTFETAAPGPTYSGIESPQNFTFDNAAPGPVYGVDFSPPVVLDLTGNGINITPLTSSSQFFDLTGDGYKNATAWAGNGNGVLVLDPSGNGTINSPLDIDFTKWDPAATSDMQALRDVFDTNHNGKLDPGDTDWGMFKVLVTNPDGTTTLKTLAWFGITSIDLTTNNADLVLADGSKIVGETTYTMSGGVTRTAADVSLAYDANGYATQQTTTTNADNSTTIDVKAFNSDGSLAKEIVTHTSADGLTRTIQFDNTGDGLFDQNQNDVTVVNADSSRTETLTFSNAASVVTERTVTTTSANGQSITIQRDHSGNGTFDQIETHGVNAAGAGVITISNLNPDGSLKDQLQTTVSADGLGKTVKTDLNGDGQFDAIHSDGTVIHADGSRTETITDANNDGSLRDGSVTTTSADGLTKTTAADLDGDGTTDLTTRSAIAIDADGSSTTTQQVFNGNSTDLTSLRDQTVTELSANGLTRITKQDFDGDGRFDLVTADATVNNSNGSTTETVTDVSADSADGTLLDQTVTTRSADGRTRTITADTNGDGINDRVETIVVNASGTVDTVTDTNADGSLKDATVTTTSADGLSITTRRDSTGRRDAETALPVFDLTITDNTSVNQNGTSFTATNINNQYGYGWTTFTTAYDANGNITSQTGAQQSGGSWKNLYTVAATRYEVETFDAGNNLLTQTIANADGTYTLNAYDPDNQNPWSTFTIHYDANWNLIGSPTGTNHTGTFSSFEAYNALDTLTWYANPFVPVAPPAGAAGPAGGRTETVTSYSSSGAMIAQTVTTTSGDGLSTTTRQDTTGNGQFDRTQTDVTILNADGSRTETVRDMNQDSSPRDQTVTITSANRLSVSVAVDANGDGTVDQTRSTATISNGSVVQTVIDSNADGSLRDETVTATSATGLSITTQSDTTGQRDANDNPIFDHTRTDLTVLNANGSRTETVTDTSANGSLVDQTVTTTSANGLSITTQSDTTGQQDANGKPVFDHMRTDLTALNTDGSKTETVTDTSANGTRDQIVTTTSGNGLSITTQTDSTGAGRFDETRSDVTVFSTNGNTTETMTDKNSDSSIRDRTVTTTSANGNNVAITRDINGDGVTDQTETIAVAADGRKIDTVSDLSANGTLRDEKVTTTSATGLSVTTQFDTNGDATTDRTRTDVTTIFSTGDRGETITDHDASGRATDEIVVTTSANGLSKTTQWDDTGLGQTFDDGTGTFDLTETDLTTLNADGSSVETVSDSGPFGLPIKQFSTTTSADHNTVTVQRIVYDTTGAIKTSATDVTQRHTDGSLVSTISDYDSDRTLTDRSFITTSANGLSITTQCDTNGDTTIDQTRTDVTVLNADGSRTETVTDHNAVNAVTDLTVTTVTANGLTTTTHYDLTGTGTFAETKTDVTTIDANGGTTETLTYQGANGALTAEYVQTTSANGLSVTKQWDTTGQNDANGHPIFDQTATDVTVLNHGSPATVTITNTNDQYGFGWTTFTVNYDGSGNITSEAGAQANGSSWQNTYNAAGTGSYEIDTYDANHNLETRSVTNADGTRTLTANDTANAYQWSTFTIQFDADWNPNPATVTGSNHDGSAVTPSEAFNALDTLTWYASPYVPVTPPPPPSDGASSRTETQTADVNGSMISQTVTTTSANGLSKTIEKDTTGNGTFDQTQIIVDSKNADGSTGETVTDYKADGSVKDSAVTTTSADGRTVTVERDANGDGSVDQIQTTFTNVDGSTVSTTTDFIVDVVTDKTIVTTSFDGLTKTTQWEFNGNGVVDRTGSDVTVVNLDGKKTETIVDTNSDGTLDQQGIMMTSADGRTKTLLEDTGGSGFFDVTATTTVAADGSTDTMTQHWGPNNLLLGYSNTTVSADGLTETVQDFTPSNVLIEQDVTDIRIDGSQITNATLYDSTGTNVIGHRVATHSANGLFDSIQLSLSSGNSEQTIDTNIDNSSKTTVTDLNPDGSEKDQVVTETAADREAATIEESVAKGDTEPTLVTGDIDAMTVTPEAITVSGNAALIIDGLGDVINLDPNSGAKLTINGTDDVVNAIGDAIILDAGAGVTVNGPSNIVDINGASTVVATSNAAINLDPNSGESVTVTGVNDVVNAIGDAVTFTAGDIATVAGSSDIIVAILGSDTITLTGSGDIVTANSDIINLFGTSGQSATVTGSGDMVNATGDVVTLGPNSTVTVDGSLDNIIGTFGNDNITLTGSNDVLNAINDTINMAANSAATITGTGDRVNASNDTITTGANTSLTALGSNDTLIVAGANDALTASNSVINGGSFAGTSVSGSSDMIFLDTNSGASVSVLGTGDTVNGTGDAIAFGAHSTVTVNGNSDAITGTAGNDNITLTGSNDVLNVIGDMITMNAGSGATVTVTGSNDTLIANNDTIISGANTSFTVQGSGDLVNVTGTGDILTASNDTITMNAGNGATVTLTGSNDIVNASNDTLHLGAPTGTTVNGSNDTVFLDPNSGASIKVSGSNDPLHPDAVFAAGDAVEVTSGVVNVHGDFAQVRADDFSTVDVSGNGDTITASHATIELESNQIVRVLGNEDLIEFNGTNDGVIVSNAAQIIAPPGDAVAIEGIDDTAKGMVNWYGDVTGDMDDGHQAVVASGQDPFDGFDFDPEDPLVISTDGSGIRLLPLAQSQAVFDYAGDGIPRPTAWFGAGTGMVVYDKNGNGVIDNASEVLGNQFAPGVTTGFAALATLDSNHDGVIDAKDPAFAHLEIWEGTPGPDGKSQPGQLFSLSDLGIASISLAATPTSIVVDGNKIIAVGTLTFADGTTEAIDDVTFDTNIAVGPTLGPIEDRNTQADRLAAANDIGANGSQITLGGWLSSAGSQLDDVTTGTRLDSQVSQLAQELAANSFNPGVDPTYINQILHDPGLLGGVAPAWH